MAALATEFADAAFVFQLIGRSRFDISQRDRPVNRKWTGGNPPQTRKMCAAAQRKAHFMGYAAHISTRRNRHRERSSIPIQFVYLKCLNRDPRRRHLRGLMPALAN